MDPLSVLADKAFRKRGWIVRKSDLSSARRKTETNSCLDPNFDPSTVADQMIVVWTSKQTNAPEIYKRPKCAANFRQISANRFQETQKTIRHYLNGPLDDKEN